MLFYVILCYFMLFHVILCYVMLCYAMLCYSEQKRIKCGELPSNYSVPVSPFLEPWGLGWLSAGDPTVHTTSYARQGKLDFQKKRYKSDN